MLHQVGIKAIGIENVLKFNGQDDDTTTDLVLGNFQAQYFLFRKGELG